jgi:4-hydroxy-tetrahydrodipicolinate synthase
LGGHGVVSVTANVAPQLMQEMCAAAFSGNLNVACEINSKLFMLHTKLFIEANPIPVKWALAELGKIRQGIRLPLVTLSEAHHETLRAAMKHAQLM